MHSYLCSLNFWGSFRVRYQVAYAFNQYSYSFTYFILNVTELLATDDNLEQRKFWCVHPCYYSSWNLTTLQPNVLRRHIGCLYSEAKWNPYIFTFLQAFIVCTFEEVLWPWIKSIARYVCIYTFPAPLNTKKKNCFWNVDCLSSCMSRYVCMYVRLKGWMYSIHICVRAHSYRSVRVSIFRP
jgi:hypothetical protein